MRKYYKKKITYEHAYKSIRNGEMHLIHKAKSAHIKSKQGDASGDSRETYSKRCVG